MRETNPLLHSLLTIETMQETTPAQPKQIFMVLPGSSPSEGEEDKEPEDLPNPPLKRPSDSPDEVGAKKPKRGGSGRPRARRARGTGHAPAAQ